MKRWKRALMLPWAGGGAPAPSSLLTGLVAYWQLEEASGNRADATGRGNTLAPTNTPGNAAGRVSNAVQFVAASSQDLHATSNADMQIGDNTATIACWAYLDTKTVERTVLCKYGGAAANWEYGIRYNATNDRFEFLWAKDALLTIAIATASTFGSPSLATWYFIVAQHDPATDLIKISVNNGAFNTAATSGGFNTSSINFTVGARGSGGGNFMDGRVDEVGKWTRLLSAAEITSLYNGGNGTTYPF